MRAVFQCLAPGPELQLGAQSSSYILARHCFCAYFHAQMLWQKPIRMTQSSSVCAGRLTQIAQFLQGQVRGRLGFVGQHAPTTQRKAAQQHSLSWSANRELSHLASRRQCGERSERKFTGMVLRGQATGFGRGAVVDYTPAR